MISHRSSLRTESRQSHSSGMASYFQLILEARLSKCSPEPECTCQVSQHRPRSKDVLFKREKPEPMHPGKVLSEIYLNEIGINQTTLAALCACTPRKISEIINGKRGISANLLSCWKIFWEPALRCGCTCRLNTISGSRVEIKLNLGAPKCFARRGLMHSFPQTVPTQCRGGATHTLEL